MQGLKVGQGEPKLNVGSVHGGKLWCASLLPTGKAWLKCQTWLCGDGPPAPPESNRAHALMIRSLFDPPLLTDHAFSYLVFTGLSRVKIQNSLRVLVNLLSWLQWGGWPVGGDISLQRISGTSTYMWQFAKSNQWVACLKGASYSNDLIKLFAN